MARVEAASPAGAPDSEEARPCASEALLFALKETDECMRDRLAMLLDEDPITIQDIENTGSALLDASKARDAPEIRRIMRSALPGDVLKWHIDEALKTALRNADLQSVRVLCELGMTKTFTTLAMAPIYLALSCTEESFAETAGLLRWLIVGLGVNVDAPYKAPKGSGKEDSGHSVAAGVVPGDGWTALCVACHRLLPPLCHLLLQLGADPNSVGRDGRMPLSIAESAPTPDTDTSIPPTARRLPRGASLCESTYGPSVGVNLPATTFPAVAEQRAGDQRENGTRLAAKGEERKAEGEEPFMAPSVSESKRLIVAMLRQRGAMRDWRQMLRRDQGRQ
ncbi:unnamed protein product [Vitrella brassicaformis CCMP3155]|uniref:Uncharacterized protein n=1 Tax=Vitrella brassicaformis (strain CCMP3155) TaxID=1169540 RepID=A0A0G4EYK5_VITBC|nr:unnamed protein product [Vitrella brassicaformis CCMP3155]|eukprot:CEM04138.1 unnamed protein product [Vitrella brassicaformis CCMP3155]